MPLTVITLSTVPPSLRGDITKWMQEIATGVYVGNFNRKIREELWLRVKQSVGNGSATMSYADRNEIGYQFETFQTQRRVVDYDGIPLVQIIQNQVEKEIPKKGFSDAAKFRYAKKNSSMKNTIPNKPTPYIILDIETDGLNENEHFIIEIGAIRVENTKISEFHSFVEYKGSLPSEIISLTGISNDLLKKEGIPIVKVIEELLLFIDDYIIIGYGVDFDRRFINKELQRMGIEPLKNKVYDLMKFVKKEKKFLKNYRLDTVLQAYEIFEEVPHRALADAKLIHELLGKVNIFWKMLK